MRRRHFLVLSSSTIGGVLIYSLDRKAQLLSAQERPVRVPLRFFTEAEALIVASATARIFPTDDSGVGAAQAGVTIYIDRQLAGPWGHDRYRYAQAPFEDVAPEFGYQGKATPREIYREGLKKLAGFQELDIVKQDEALRGVESLSLFALLRQNTIEGMFCDPIHGGNADMVGWQLVGFPGARMSYFDDIEKHYGATFRPKPASLVEITGLKIAPNEDEK